MDAEGNRIGARSSKFFSSALVALETKRAVRKGQKTKGAARRAFTNIVRAVPEDTGAGSGVGENNGRTRWRRSRSP